MAHQTLADDRLLRAVAEQLKLPLLQIARQAELSGDNQTALQGILETAQMAIQLVDSFVLSTDVHAQHSLQLEPVSIASILHETAELLQARAEQYGSEVSVSLSGKYGPVMGNPRALQSAFLTLGYALIEAQSEEQPRQVVLAAHKSSEGIVAGVFSSQENLSTEMFRRARALYGSARQPLAGASGSASAGIFVADSLLSALASPLRVARHHKLNGLATTLLPSKQLQLI